MMDRNRQNIAWFLLIIISLFSVAHFPELKAGTRCPYQIKQFDNLNQVYQAALIKNDIAPTTAENNYIPANQPANHQDLLPNLAPWSIFITKETLVLSSFHIRALVLYGLKKLIFPFHTFW